MISGPFLELVYQKSTFENSQPSSLVKKIHFSEGTQKMVNVKDEKLRQRVREESEELRQLKSALVRGYVNKEREKQIREKIERQQEAIVDEIQVQIDTKEPIVFSTNF